MDFQVGIGRCHSLAEEHPTGTGKVTGSAPVGWLRGLRIFSE